MRKYGACGTGPTQNVDDLLQSHTARTMLANSEFLLMLNQAATDRVELARLLNISDNQLSYISGVDFGHGLLKCGSTIVPFADHFPRSGRLIAQTLQNEKIEISGKNFSFSKNMIMNILRNEKYCGDSILQKTVTVDCISKTRKANQGEAPMYLVENSHPAIISRERFHRAQEELARRKTLRPKSDKTSITETGKYSKYALTEVLHVPSAAAATSA